MSISRWFYHVGVCDWNPCCGDCDRCDIMKNPEEYGIDDSDDDEEQQITSARKGEE